ncbi:GNAT family N-acetyltransferase [Kaistella palustris]|uniref:GNAT family N-acetyltransferase n=1 Tax=Kaistella palustris TaxID=493376 RepID=UPI00040E66A5|nr:GNAT family N-acetyltransferase [Kaistella palustris]
MSEVKLNGNNFELFVDGAKAGEMTFQKKDDGSIDIVHTQVDEKYSGQGLGKELVKAGTDYAKSQNLKVTASCPYAHKVISSTPEFQ